MEWVDYTVEDQREFNSTDINSCQLFGCPDHGVSLVMTEKGQVFSTDDQYSIDLPFPNSIDQIVCTCRKEMETCQFYFRSVTNQVYEWNMQLDKNRSRKRMKLDSNSSINVSEYNLISENIQHMMPFDKSGILLFSSLQVDIIDFDTNARRESSQFRPSDNKITSHQYFNGMDSCLSNFFSLGSINHGLLYGTREGSLYCRHLESDGIYDTLIAAFESSEKILHVELLNISALSNYLNTIVAIGDRGTIMIYSRASSDPMESGVNFKQFNIQGPIYSFGKASTDATYLVTSGIGRISMLRLKFTTNDIELDSTYLKSGPYNFRQLRICDSFKFDALCNDGIIRHIRFNPIPVSIADHAENISALIKDTLAELEFSENTVKALVDQEQALNQKLYSTNRTLYELRSIHQKRTQGICNTLEDTGFEFHLRPITRSESISNLSLHSTSYLRICIKTSKFLQLEDWDLVLHLIPPSKSNSQLQLRGETKTVPVIGFETQQHENGMEYSYWERDVEMNLEESLTLPLQVSATLVMSVQGELPLRFPVSKIRVDDLHFAMPCSHLMTSIERRGLEEISMRWMDSYNKQKLNDKTGRYPFARLLKSKLSDKELPPQKYMFNYNNVHVRCLVNPQIKQDSYRSILSIILGEGRSMDELSGMLTSAEQALFTLAAHPGIPIMIHLSRVSSSMIDFSIQCIHPPTLFKTEAALLGRLYKNFIKPISGSDTEEENQEKNAIFLKNLKLLENSVIDLQEKYQALNDPMDMDGCDDSSDLVLMDQLKKAVDMLLALHNEEPIGEFDDRRLN